MSYPISFYHVQSNQFVLGQIGITRQTESPRFYIPARQYNTHEFNDIINNVSIVSNGPHVMTEWIDNNDVISFSPEEYKRLRENTKLHRRMFERRKKIKIHIIKCKCCNKQVTLETGFETPPINYVALDIAVCPDCIQGARKRGRNAVKLAKTKIKKPNGDIMLRKSKPILIPGKDTDVLGTEIRSIVLKDKESPYTEVKLPGLLKQIDPLIMPHIIPLSVDWLKGVKNKCSAKYGKLNNKRKNGTIYPVENRITWYKMKKKCGIGMKQIFPGQSIRKDTLDRVINNQEIVVYGYDSKADSDQTFRMVGWLSDGYPEEVIMEINRTLNKKKYIMFWGMPDFNRIPIHEQSFEANICMGMWLLPSIPGQVINDIFESFNKGYEKFKDNHQVVLQEVL